MNQHELARKFLCSISAAGEYLFYPLSASQIEQANFLDIGNLKLEDSEPERISVHDYHDQENAWPLRYIFHTAFCGSTLLSRALHETPKLMVLKEPDVLMKISNQSLLAGNKQIIPYLLASLKELSQPWSQAGSVIIKPSNSVNRLIMEIIENYPGKTLLLYSGLEDFLISCFKKLPSAEQKIRWMAQHLLHQTALQKKLDVDTYHPFGFVESCIITWYAQMEYFAKAIAQDNKDQIRTLDMKDMLAKPFESVQAAVQFFGLEKSNSEIEASVNREFTRNSKKLDKIYSDAERSQEASQVREKYSALLQVALTWAEQNIAPIAMIPEKYKPLV